MPGVQTLGGEGSPFLIPLLGRSAMSLDDSKVDTDGDVMAGELVEYQITYGGDASLASIDRDGNECVA